MRQVYQVAVFIFGDIALLEADEIFQLFWVAAGKPAGLVKWQAVHLYGGAVLLQQPVLYHFKLQLAYATDNFFIATKLCKQLRHAFIG